MLDKIIAVKQQEVEEAKKIRPIEDLVKSADNMPPARDFRGALAGNPCAVIAEIKRSSPSKGSMRDQVDPVAIASQYARHGAAAISVLTDQSFFGGSADDLIQVRQAVTVPVLRKDFIIDPYQIYETRLMGADAMLLIADILEQETLAGFIARAAFLGLGCLVEVHSREALERALGAGAEIIGINNRDLDTFQVNLQTSLDMRPLIPEGKVVVSESAIRDRQDIETLMKAGIRAFLIGETLMKADNVGETLRSLMGQGG